MESAIASFDEELSVESVYRRDSDRMWRSLFAFAGDADIASDAMAEAYAQLLRRGAAVNDPAAWAWRAAFRIAAGALKDRRVRDGLAPRPATVSDAYEDTDLLRALSKLPESQRGAVVLFYYADLPIRDIAHRLGSSSLAVRANLSRGRKRLRLLLGDDHG